MLRITDIIYRAGGRQILERASLAVNQDDRVGLIGRNGSGKTTLLKLIAGALHPDGGEVAVPRGLYGGTGPASVARVGSRGFWAPAIEACETTCQIAHA